MENNTYNQFPNEENKQGQSQQIYGEQGNYQLDLEVPVSMGEWLVSLLIMCIPCVNIVMVFVWAFSKSEKRSKSNYFKAQLIFGGIIIVLWILFLIVFGVGAIGALQSLY